MSEVELVLVIIGVATFIVAFLTLLATWRDVKVSERAERLSQRAVELAQEETERRPKLELYVGDEQNQAIKKDGDVYVHATIANVGKVAAHNIHARLEFKPKGRVEVVERRMYPQTTVRYDRHILNSHENWATLYWEQLVANTSPVEGTLQERSFLQSPRHFIIPVRVSVEGVAQLHFWFTCDECDEIEGVVDLDLPATSR